MKCLTRNPAQNRIVASLHNVDEKVNALREQRINDPDDLCDKMFKVAAPTLAGLVFGKLFELAWRKSVGHKAVLPDGTPTNARNWR